MTVVQRLLAARKWLLPILAAAETVIENLERGKAITLEIRRRKADGLIEAEVVSGEGLAAVRGAKARATAARAKAQAEAASKRAEEGPSGE